jgi:hypothetical protein
VVLLLIISPPDPGTVTTVFEMPVPHITLSLITSFILQNDVTSAVVVNCWNFSGNIKFKNFTHNLVILIYTSGRGGFKVRLSPSIFNPVIYFFI